MPLTVSVEVLPRDREVLASWVRSPGVGLGECLEAAADVDRLLAAAVAELTTGLDLRDVNVGYLGSTLVAGTGGAPASVVPADAAALVCTGTIAGAGPGGASIPLLGLRHRGPLADLRGAGPPAKRGRGAAACTIWSGGSATRCTRDCSARTCSAPGNGWSRPARKNGAACAGTCTTALTPRWLNSLTQAARTPAHAQDSARPHTRARTRGSR